MDKSRNILLVTPLYPPDVGGPATHAVFVENNLPPFGYRVTKCYFGDVKKYPYIIRHIIFFFIVLRAAHGADTVYALDPLGVGLPAALAARFWSKRFVVRVPGDRAWETGVQKFAVKEDLEDFATKKFYSFIVFPFKFGQTITTLLARKVVVPSEYMRRVVMFWGVHENKIAIVSSAYEPQLLPDKDALRVKLGIRGYSIVSAGRLVPWKGFRLLIELFPEVLSSRGDATLTIVCDGPDQGTLKQLVATLNLSDKIIFTGNILHQEVLERVRAGHLFVLNTGYEGLSHQLIEVMDMETPIITTRVGGNPELIENDRDGVLVGYNNRKELLTSITDMMINPIRARYFTENAKMKLNNYSSEKVVSKLAELL